MLVQIEDDIGQEPWHCKSYAICQSVYKGTPKMGLELNGKYQPYENYTIICILFESSWNVLFVNMSIRYSQNELGIKRKNIIFM